MTNINTKNLSAPNVSLQTAIKHAQTLFNEYMGSAFTNNDMATKWKITAGAGGFNQRRAAMTAYGLLMPSANQYSLTAEAKELFDDGASEERKLAIKYQMVTRTTFSKLIKAEFGDRLPATSTIVTRLTEKGYKKGVSETATKSLRESLTDLDAIDSKGHILPPKHAGAPAGAGTGGGGDRDPDKDEYEEEPKKKKKRREPAEPDLLISEVPLAGGRKGVLYYPEGLTKADAERISAVISAMAID